jgi:hypothetical protein
LCSLDSDDEVKAGGLDSLFFESLPRLTMVSIFRDVQGMDSEVAAMEDLPLTPVKPSHAASPSPSPFSPVNTNTRWPREVIDLCDDEDDDKPVRRVLCDVCLNVTPRHAY